MEAVNRKLIRPSLNEIKEQIAPPRRAPLQKKPVPPDQTNAENFYYVKQMQGKYKIKEPTLQELAKQVIILQKHFSNVMFTHVRREFNTEADKLVNQAIDQALG